MWNLNYDTNELQNRNKLTDTENRLVVAWGGVGRAQGERGGLADGSFKYI